MTEAFQPKKPFWKRVSFWGVVLFGGTVIYTQIPIFPAKITTETYFLTEPRRSDGKGVDYYAAWESLTAEQFRKPEENGFGMLIEALGTPLFHETKEGWDELTQNQWEGLCRKFGVNPEGNAPYSDFQPLGDFLQEHFTASDDSETAKNAEGRAYETVEKLQKTPWSDTLEPLAAQWLTDVSPLLDVLGEAVRKPYFSEYLPRPQNSALQCTLPQTMIALRNLAQGLEIRIFYRMAQNDTEGALYDLCTLYRMGAGSAKTPMAVAALAGTAFQTTANETAAKIIGSGKLTDAQIAELDAFIVQSVPDFDWKRVYYGEQFYCYDGLQDAQRFEKWWVCDWNIARKQFTVQMNQLLEIAKMPDFERRRDARQKFWKELNARDPKWFQRLTIQQRSRIQGDDWFELCNMMDCVQIGLERANLRTHLTRIGLALERFRLKNGTFPESLNALVPEFWPTSNGKIRFDATTGKETIVYRRNSDGSHFQLYGFGPNLKDDGGVRPGEKGDDENYDIVF